jgi:hypothetical protein
MHLQRKIGPLRVALMSVAVFTVFALPVRPGEQATAAAKRPGTTKGSDWSFRLEPDATIVILYQGAEVIKSWNVYWGKGGTWVGTDFKVQDGADGRSTIVGNLPALKLKVNGRATSPSPDRLVMDLVFQAAESFPELIGGGWHWSFKLDSPEFAQRLPDPVLLENNSGWSFQTGPGQVLSLRFEPSIAKVYNEQGQRTEIRTFFMADSMESGTRRVRMTLQLPEGGKRVRSAAERYGPTDTSRWFRGALAWDEAPVDLSFLNRDDKPAGRRGFIRADGDRFVHEDGTPVRFWGGNIVASTLFSTPRENVRRQAHRMAQLGYNLMRVHHHDSEWVNPNIFDRRYNDTRHLNASSLESLDWWIKCLKDEGIYVWLDMLVGRQTKPGDGITEGSDEIAKAKGVLKGFDYYNRQVQDLMKEFQNNFLNHLNPHTKLRYKDDPAVMGVLITNEDDLTNHEGNMMLPDNKNYVHNAAWDKGYKAFAHRHGLDASQVYRTWLPGPSKLYLNEAEHNFNELMITDLRKLGVKAPIATTNLWGRDPLFSVPALTDGDVIDVHSYGKSEAMNVNPRYQGNYIPWIAFGQVYGKPLSITEWNVEYPQVDRFTSPLYVASIAALQGWDAPMLFTYSILPLKADGIRPETWSTSHDPAMSGVIPAAALAYRQGHVSPARTTYCLMLDPGQLFDRAITPDTSATIRTLAEQSKLTIGLPQVKELPWLKPTKPADDVTRLTDPDHDFIPAGQSFVRSDTNELTRDWIRGIQTIDTPKTQAVSGWVGGNTIKTRDATFETSTKKAVIALSSVDNRSLNTSHFIMITAVARVVPSPGNRMPFLSEPVLTRISLRTQNTGLMLLALGKDGRVVGRSKPRREGDVLTIQLPTGGGTHWYVLKSTDPEDSSKASLKAASGPSS